MNYQTNTLYRSCKLCLKNRSYKNDGKALRPNAGIEESGYKKCSRCGEVKAETEFHRKGKYRQPFCITCRLAYLKEHRAKPHVKEYRKLERQVSKASKRASFLGRKNYVKIPDIVKLFHRQDEKCFYCGEKMLKTDFTIDHVIPFSKGGHNTIGNILLCCRSCNAKKARKLLIEWLPPSERIW